MSTPRKQVSFQEPLQASTPNIPPYNSLPYQELPYHVLLEERKHYIEQIQQLQQEKDSALTRNADLIAFLRSEKTRLENQLKAQKSLVHIKEEELIKLRRQLLEASNIITAGNAMISNLQQALTEATEGLISARPFRIPLPNPTSQVHLSPFTVGQQNQFPPLALPPQDEVVSLRWHKGQSSQEEPVAVSPLGFEDCIPMDETEDSVIMEARHRRASEEECFGSPSYQLPQDPSILDPTTSSPLERVRTADEAPLAGLESGKPGDTSNIKPVMDQAKSQFVVASQETEAQFQVQIGPGEFDVWQVLETLIGTIFIEGRANTTIVCGTCRDVEWCLNLPEEDLKAALIKHAEEVHPLELANALSLFHGEQVDLQAMSSYIPNSLSSISLTTSASLGLGLIILAKYWSSRSRLPYPPGPRPLPIIGNFFDIPSSKFTLAWTKMAQQYGPLTYLTVPGQRFLIITSVEAARDLLEKRGSIYVDRPRFVMVGELLGLDYLTMLSRFSPTWRKHRSLLKHALSPQVVKRDYLAQLTKKGEEYVECLLARPEEFLADLNKIMAENIIELTYGRKSDEDGRDYVKLNTYVMEVSVAAMEGYLVNFIPALRHLPSWLPGMKFKRDAVKWKQEIDDVRTVTFERAKRSAVSGDSGNVSSYMLNNLRELYHKHEESNKVGSLEEDELAISQTGFSFFIAGVDTTQYTAHGLLLAMTLFPSVQEKAQAEIDCVVGHDRLPTFEDQEDMPYLRAVVLETLRWSPSVPTGLAHRSLSDDVYNGYFIPEGTTIIANTWGMTRSTNYYQNPSVFDPERYLRPDPELDPREFVFGFGRRLCPGNELAFQAIWIMAASILSSFKLTRAVGDSTALDDDLNRFNFEFLNSPVAFKCHIVPRSDKLKEKLSHSSF